MRKITLLILMTFLSFVSYGQLTEGFEGAVFPPVGWTVTDNAVATSVSWASTSVPVFVHAGTKAAYLNSENTGGPLSQDWLITKPVSLAGITNGQLKFYTRQGTFGDQGGKFQIKVATSATNVMPPLASFVQAQEWDETSLNAPFDLYQQKTVSLTAFANQPFVWVAFVGVRNPTGDRWLVDDVEIEELCFEPTNLAMNTPTLISANLTWTANSGETTWDINIVAQGAPNDPATVTSNITTNNYLKGGLTQGTAYDYYVRAACASGSHSNWVGPFSFSTRFYGETCEAPITVPSLPYTHSSNTANYGNHYTGSPGTSCGIAGAYLNGDDVVYAYTPDFTGAINMTMTPQGQKTGMFVYTNCADIG
uniref:choice-of-anchor J domain-containing protein n=1 Tax=Flavobacterium aerium TaxID=3037261 RepID=UPI00278C7E54